MKKEDLYKLINEATYYLVSDPTFETCNDEELDKILSAFFKCKKNKRVNCYNERIAELIDENKENFLNK